MNVTINTTKENEKKFNTGLHSDGDCEYSLLEKNVITYHQKFNLTKFDATNIITVHLKTNKGEEIVIELEK